MSSIYDPEIVRWLRSRNTSYIVLLIADRREREKCVEGPDMPYDVVRERQAELLNYACDELDLRIPTNP